MLKQHTPHWIRGCAVIEASTMDPDKHRQLNCLDVNIMLCECGLARPHDEKIQTLKFVLTVVRKR